MPQSLTASDWTTVLHWCDANLKNGTPEQKAIEHFALPENGGFVFRKQTLQRRQGEWKKAKRTGQEPAFDLTGGYPAVLDSEWLRVFKFMDEHPTYSQAEVTEHFVREGGLKFHQSTFGTKLMDREGIERRVREAEDAKGRGRAQPQKNERTVRRRESTRQINSSTSSAGPSRIPPLEAPSARNPRKAKDNDIEAEHAPRRLLTDSQWLQVLEFFDEHPSWTKTEIASHFELQGMSFHRSTLSRKLLERNSIEFRVFGAVKKAKKEATQPLSPNKTEVKLPKPVAFSSQRWSSRLAKGPLSPPHNVVELGPPTAQSRDEACEKEGGGKNQENGNLFDFDDEHLTPLPETPPRSRTSPPTAITATPFSLTTTPPLQLPPSLESSSAALLDSPLGDDAPSISNNLATELATSGETAATPSAPPRFKRKRTHPTFSAPTTHAPTEKRARLASLECDSEPTPSLSISSLPTASESSASMRSTPMSPSESHSDLPDSSQILSANLEVEPLDLPSGLRSLSAPVSGFSGAPHSKESLSLRSRLWDAWLP